MGRGGDLAALAQLEAEGERLITVHGAAGMGKTRLAREYARRVEEEKSVFFVDLTSARSFEDVGIAVTAAFDLSASHMGSAANTLSRAARILEERAPALVLLHNFEQLVDCAVEVIEPLLAARGATVSPPARRSHEPSTGSRSPSSAPHHASRSSVRWPFASASRDRSTSSPAHLATSAWTRLMRAAKRGISEPVCSASRVRVGHAPCGRR